MKTPKIADFHDKITLCRAVSTVDNELNRIETVEPVQDVWARVEVRNSIVDGTTAGSRPEIRYTITIRQQSIVCDYIRYKGRLLRVTAPWYPVENKYIVIEATEIVR